MTTRTIAIHAVTQHYTSPIVLKPGMVGTPRAICVTWGHVGHTTPVLPDSYNNDETAIITGGDGTCHTTALDGDTQVIKVGQAIPADLVPQDVPSTSQLQTYLNQVFGNQANLRFVVTRNDFTVNYDLNTNGILDISPLSRFQTSEEKTVSNHADATAGCNIYYVKDFDSTAISVPGLVNVPSSHDAVGSSSFFLKQTFMRDYNTDIPRATAHEVGHLRNLNHTSDASLPSGAKNPANTALVSDPSPIRPPNVSRYFWNWHAPNPT